jgi:hypothetical protein
MVPPWVEDVPSEPSDDDGDSGEQDQQLPDLDQDPTAPFARFSSARRNLGSFVVTGNSRDLRRGLRYYVATGYGGSRTFTRRHAGTATTAGRLGTVLESGRAPDGASLHDQALTGGSDVNRIMDAIVEAVRPVDGTQDAEASRKAVRDALSDLLDQYPDADLLNLDDAQRQFVIERYTALDVYGRLCLDLEKAVVAKAPDFVTALSRLAEIRGFIVQSISSSFRRLRGGATAITTSRIATITKRALAETFAVFEEYAG